MELETFNHIPSLNQILRAGGFPGYVYYYISTVNQGTAFQRGLKPTDKNEPFRISGPKGSVDAILMVDGQHIQGASPDASKQDVLVDNAIYVESGLLTPDEVKAKVPPAEGGVTIRGDATGPIETTADAAARKADELTKKGSKQ